MIVVTKKAQNGVNVEESKSFGALYDESEGCGTNYTSYHNNNNDNKK